LYLSTKLEGTIQIKPPNGWLVLFSHVKIFYCSAIQLFLCSTVRERNKNGNIENGNVFKVNVQYKQCTLPTCTPIWQVLTLAVATVLIQIVN